jgi:hypothetical protein
VDICDPVTTKVAVAGAPTESAFQIHNNLKSMLHMLSIDTLPKHEIL